MIEELRPCPFCGSTDLLWYYYDVDNLNNPFDPCVVCNGCGLVIKFHGSERYKMTMDDIRKKWNRRVDE